MAGEATRSGNFIPFGAETLGQSRSGLRAGGHNPIEEAILAFMDLPRQSAAPATSPVPTPRPQQTPSGAKGTSRKTAEGGGRRSAPIETRRVPPSRGGFQGERPTGRKRPARFDPDMNAAVAATDSDSPELDVATRIYTRLRETGVPEPAAAGILGNIKQESNFDPNAVGDNGNSIGFAQWNGPRKRALQQFARQQGRELNEQGIPDVDTQIDFLLHEFQNAEASAASTIFNAPSPDLAAVAASRNFWRPGEPHIENRIRYAEEFAQQFEGFTPPPPPGDRMPMAVEGDQPPSQLPAQIQQAQGQAQPAVSQEMLQRVLEALGARGFGAEDMRPQQPPLDANRMPPAPQPQQPLQQAPMPPAQAPVQPPVTPPPARAPLQNPSTELGTALREYLSTGDLSALEKVPARQRPVLLQTLGAAIRGR